MKSVDVMLKESNLVCAFARAELIINNEKSSHEAKLRKHDY